MPESDFQDDINKIKNTVWTTPLKVCVLEHYYTGTFCFPYGPGFGCGSNMSIAKGESQTMSGSFGAGGASVGASVTFTASTTWSHTSGRCEWCIPQICYENSTMEVWECESFLDWYSWTSQFVRFTPGRPSIFPNCKIDNEKCNCTEGVAHAVAPGGGGGYDGVQEESHAMAVISTFDFRKRDGESRSNPEEDLRQAASHVDSLVNSPGMDGCRQGNAVVAALPGDRRVVLTGPDASKDELALLSMSGCGTRRGSLRVLAGGLIPVLAVGQPVPGGKAQVRLTNHQPSGSKVLLDESAPVHVDKLTTIWKELSLPAGSLEPGETAELVVDLLDRDGRLAATLCETVWMPYEIAELDSQT